MDNPENPEVPPPLKANGLQFLTHLIERNGVPTIYADGVLGVASANGVDRVAFGHVEFNPMDGATAPLSKPVLNLIIPHASLVIWARSIIAEDTADESSVGDALDE